MTQKIRVSQIKMPLAHTTEDVLKRVCKLLRITTDQISDFSIVKQSIDARKKDQIHYIYTAQVAVKPGVRVFTKDKNITFCETTAYQLPQANGKKPVHPPVVIGAGPAGLFCAYLLSAAGLDPIVIERGKMVDARQQDVDAFWKTGVLNTQSNVQFGEGGAGTFSDGKLNTLVKDKFGRNRFVLDTFVACGAPEEILYAGKPHIGTDILCRVVRQLREKIISLGGTFQFETTVTDFVIEKSVLTGVKTNRGEQIATNQCVLAAGHSARDTFEVLYERQVPMQAKDFAVGFRVEHPQSMINQSQYGVSSHPALPPSPYKVTYHAKNGRSVYSFCMCPGGYVVNASSEEGHLAVNGMSYHLRDSENANSAIIVNVTPEDFGTEHPLAGMYYQRRLEAQTFQAGNGKIPQQLFGDYETNTTSSGYGEFSSCHKGTSVFANLNGLLSEPMKEAFCEGMHGFAGKIKGFDRTDCILSGMESRTSSPVRILRGEDYMSTIKGLYPCGEGAGYAGGITSAAMDGIKVAEAIISQS